MTELHPPPLPALVLAGVPRRTRLLARGLAVLTAAILVGVFLVPWQQTVRATGRVIAFNPLDRRVNVEAPVSYGFNFFNYPLQKQSFKIVF